MSAPKTTMQDTRWQGVNPAIFEASSNVTTYADLAWKQGPMAQYRITEIVKVSQNLFVVTKASPEGVSISTVDNSKEEYPLSQVEESYEFTLEGTTIPGPKGRIENLFFDAITGPTKMCKTERAEREEHVKNRLLNKAGTTNRKFDSFYTYTEFRD